VCLDVFDGKLGIAHGIAVALRRGDRHAGIEVTDHAGDLRIDELLRDQGAPVPASAPPGRPRLRSNLTGFAADPELLD